MYSELFIPVAARSCPSPLTCTTQRASYLKSGRHKTSLLPMRLILALLTHLLNKKERKGRKEGRKYTSTTSFTEDLQLSPALYTQGPPDERTVWYISEIGHFLPFLFVMYEMKLTYLKICPFKVANSLVFNIS